MKNSLLFSFLLCSLNLVLFAQSPDDFVTTWLTILPGTSNDSSIEIPTVGDGYNYDVDWNNDGVFDDFGVTGNVSHDYLIPGTYTVRIQGDFPTLGMYAGGDKNKLLEVNQWGSISWSNLTSAFRDCAFVTVVAMDEPNLLNVTDLSHMFESASGDHHVSHWDVSTIQNMNSMFIGTHGFDENLESWNVSNVVDMENMFFDVNLSTSNYDFLLISWAAQELQTGVNFHGGNSQYCSQEASDARDSMINNNLWVITDAGYDETCSNLSPCAVDFDGNGIVDGLDFGIFLGNYSLTCSMPLCSTDFNGDGVTDGEDFGMFLGNFGLDCD